MCAGIVKSRLPQYSKEICCMCQPSQQNITSHPLCKIQIYISFKNYFLDSSSVADSQR